MSTTEVTATTRTALRIKALITISQGVGIRSMDLLDEEARVMFDLGSRSPEMLAKQLVRMRDYLTPSDSLEAAYYALGIDDESNTLRDRRASLLAERHGLRWDLNDLALLHAQEMTGFEVLASTWDLVLRFQHEADKRQSLKRLAGNALHGKPLEPHEVRRLNDLLGSEA